MGTKLLTVILSTAILLIVVELIRREKFTFKYAVGWIGVSACGIFLTIFDQTLSSIAGFFGFILPSNFVFFSLITIFVFLSLLMSVFLCEQSERNNRIAQKIAIIEFELQQIKTNQPSKNNIDGK